ncbi:hypothetical protein [uncultured Mobiluncus sp.]|nr:hypothetical protein [uncultured Mobiluncus sp.]
MGKNTDDLDNRKNEIGTYLHKHSGALFAIMIILAIILTVRIILTVIA